ncbi:hypothetical protein TNCV_4619041 [Trichonephila clavipes]|nr:hypothetical protein TNCV_4619041 [Trichonephila clavipes]
MRARAHCAHSSIRDHWVLRCMSPMSQSGGQSEVRPPVFKSPRKFGTHLSFHYPRDERLSQPCLARKWSLDLWRGSAMRYQSTTGPFHIN